MSQVSGFTEARIYSGAMLTFPNKGMRDARGPAFAAGAATPGGATTPEVVDDDFEDDDDDDSDDGHNLPGAAAAAGHAHAE